MPETGTVLQPTIANTLSSKNLPAMTYARQTFFEKVVLLSGYPYFEWNERVYVVRGARHEDAGVLYRDLQ